MCLRHGKPVALRGQVPHLAVGGPVVERNRGQVVEGLVQIVGYVGYRGAGQVIVSASALPVLHETFLFP